MRGTKDFIVELKEAYSETFTTENGLKIYGNVDFTSERQSNRIAKVIGLPGLYKTDIKEGFEVLIDASPIYRQIYNGVKQWYQNVVDEKKGLFHLDKMLIICYRENKESDWIGFGENSLAKPILEDQIEHKTSLILPVNVSQKKFTGRVEIKNSNKELNNLGVKNGDTVFINILGGIKYWLNGEEFWWIRNTDVRAIDLSY